MTDQKVPKHQDNASGESNSTTEADQNELNRLGLRVYRGVLYTPAAGSILKAALEAAKQDQDRD